MDVVINNAILHIIDNSGGESHISNEELDIDSDVCYEFINKHVKKLLNNPSVKEATFNPDSEVMSVMRSFMEGELYFKEASARICERLLGIMSENADIPPADVLVVQFETRKSRGRKAESLLSGEYLAILKLNYKEYFTHKTDEDESGKDNQLVKYRTALPFDSGKAEEACLISYDPMLIKLVEKPYPVNGETTNYFSELFLDCATELSKKEAVQIITDISEEINDLYANGSLENAAKIKVAIIDEAIEEEGVLSVFNVANRVFPENEEARNAFVDMAKDAGIKPDEFLGEQFLRRQFASQRFKASNGIEIKFPAELSDDAEAMEFTDNGDGSVSILLKNLRRS